MKNLYTLLFLLLLLACGNKEKLTETIQEIKINSNQIKISKEQFESEKMEFGELATQDFNTIINVNGMIDVPPENRASVSTFIAGYVTNIPLLIGDKVKKGELIASLKNIEFVEIQQQYVETSVQLKFLKNEYDRQKTLFDEKITSQRKYLEAESVYKVSLATYNGLRKKLQMLNIDPVAVAQGKITSTINLYAPINGYVTKVNVNIGSFVSSASELIEIINTDHIHLELNVFEKDITKIKKNQKIHFKIPESSNKTYEAQVHLVGTSINKNKTIKVHGHINNEEKNNFISGMFVEAEIICLPKKEIALPRAAILKNKNKSIILVLSSEKENTYIFDKVSIDKGSENENYTQINNYKAIEGRKILTKGAFIQ
ncbi:efflux RND transporter periplasmic adaptor subunit [Polaribacter sp. IC073]|uniref:efflux RND transporter periplasmic adaptor subunit n=1 Tax=Polaribacter sp. IC073 TaxID=2508540 RepID=UPI0011BF4A61|nr:efflux RND transporter periplasmic adaptor subunit [Polaribacter sp. IC073]TXD46854.1 efflux RND transporter periplasmic adaptor subunit [Polaribacter sp. IC073]